MPMSWPLAPGWTSTSTEMVSATVADLSTDGAGTSRVDGDAALVALGW
jgi:hypothetical protein